MKKENKVKYKRWAFKTEIVVAIFIAVLIVIRVAAPYAGEHYINSILKNKLESYQGSIDDLSLRVSTGSYFIDKMRIYKKQNIKRPFVYLEDLNIHLDWWMLLKGKAVLKLEILEAQLNFIDSKEPENKQLKVSKKEQQHWSEALNAIIPLSIEEVTMKDSTVNFENKDLKGANLNRVMIKSAYVKNLVDPEVNKNNLSAFKLDALVNDHAPLEISGGVNIKKDSPLVDVRYKFQKFKLVTVNELLKHYVPVDLTSGLLSILGEANGSTQNLKGYARIYIDKLDILELDQDYKSAPHFIIEWLGGFVNWTLSVLGDGQITTEIPFEIKKGDFEVDASKTFWNTVKNLGDSLPFDYKKEGSKEKLKEKKQPAKSPSKG